MAVILPDNLAPLPVSPRGDDAAGCGHSAADDFVSAAAVRGVLLGTRDELPVEGLPAEDFDSFAGRADVPYPSRVAASARQESPIRVPDLVFEPVVIHPAFEVLEPVPRRAAPPKPRELVDCEASFGRSRFSDKWWVLGMGAAAAAILFSGTLVDFVSREAMRRSMARHPQAAEIFRGSAPVVDKPEGERPKVLASSEDPDDER